MIYNIELSDEDRKQACFNPNKFNGRKNGIPPVKLSYEAENPEQAANFLGQDMCEFCMTLGDPGGFNVTAMIGGKKFLIEALPFDYDITIL